MRTGFSLYRVSTNFLKLISTYFFADNRSLIAHVGKSQDETLDTHQTIPELRIQLQTKSSSIIRQIGIRTVNLRKSHRRCRRALVSARRDRVATERTSAVRSGRTPTRTPWRVSFLFRPRPWVEPRAPGRAPPPLWREKFITEQATLPIGGV